MGRIWNFLMILVLTISIEAFAAGNNSTSLVFKKFPDFDEIESEDKGTAPRKIPKKKKAIKSSNVASDEVIKLHKLVLNNFDDEQDGYIKLSDSEFIVFASNTGSLAQGLYFADLTNNTFEQIAQGALSIKATLKDKSGSDTLWLHHSHPMRSGVGGESESLLSFRKTIRNQTIVDYVVLGSVSLSFNDEDENNNSSLCANDPKAFVSEGYQTRVVDLNNDGLPDVSVKVEKFSCASQKSLTQEVAYLAGNLGFMKAVETNASRLLNAQKSAISIFRKTKDGMSAANLLQGAGIDQFIYEKPPGMSLEDYASLLNDYAFFIGPYRNSVQALDILDRVIQLYPNRSVAYLNRAEQLYKMLYLVELKSQQEKINAAKDIMADYETYKKLSGKRIEWLEKFSAFNLVNYPANTNVCEYIKMYHESGYAKGATSGLQRMSEIFLGSKRLDINNDGTADEVEVEGYGQWTYKSISFADSKGSKYKFTGSVARKQDSGDGFEIFSFEGRIYQLLSMSDVTYIDRDKEKLMCEAEWSERTAEGRRYIKSIRLVN